LHSNPNLRRVNSNPSEELLEEPQPIYFGEGLNEDGRVHEIEESLHCLETRQLTSVEPTEEINVGTEEEPRMLKIGTGLDPTQRAQMIDFLKEYQEVFAWSYAYMPGLDPSIVKHFLPLNTENFPPKRQHLRRQRAGLLLRIKEEVVKQIDAGFLEVCNYSEWVANIVPMEKKDGRVRRLRQYTLYHTIRLLSKADPLKYLLGSPSSMRSIAKWRCQLTEYDIEYVPRTSVKGQAIADHLAEFPIEDDTPINSDFPDEGILQVDEEEDGTTWKMYFDGAVNSTGSGIGAVLISPDGRYYPIAAKVDFHCTNNVAEYEACILGLQAAIDFKALIFLCFPLGSVSFHLITFSIFSRTCPVHSILLVQGYLREKKNNFPARSKTSLRRPRQKLGNEGHNLKSRKGES
ncbi:hypothetical protein CRG98_043153, partial [Punica granatum]